VGKANSDPKQKRARRKKFCRQGIERSAAAKKAIREENRKGTPRGSSREIKRLWRE